MVTDSLASFLFFCVSMADNNFILTCFVNIGKRLRDLPVEASELRFFGTVL